jgi:hypothetical protein
LKYSKIPKVFFTPHCGGRRPTKGISDATSSALKMETVFFPETLVSTYKSTWRHNPEDEHRRLYRRENLRSHITAVSSENNIKPINRLGKM